MLDIMLNDLCGTDLFSDVWKTLNINLFNPSQSEYSTVVGIVKDLYSLTESIAIMLMIIYFILALVDKASSENFTWEQWGRQMCMFLVSFYLIIHGYEIMEQLFSLGRTFTSDVYGVVKGDLLAFIDDADRIRLIEDTVEEFKDSINVPGFLKDIILVVYLMIPWALSWIMGLVVKIICYTRMIEIYARAAFAPIALSDFFQNGFQGAGWRFLKGFFAVCIQGALILVVITIYAALFPLVVSTGGNLFKFIGLFLALLASACMLMFKSLSLAREMLGVG